MNIVERIQRRWAVCPLGVKRALPWLVVVAALWLVYGATIYEHIHLSSNPLVFNDDARIIIYPYFHYSDPALFRHDAISHYFDQEDPIGFRLLYYLAAKLWDAASFSKLLPYLLFAVILVSVAIAVNRVAGKGAAFGALALTLACSIFMERMAGGLMRAFAFPMIAVAIAALSCGRVWWLAAMVVVAAAFYPVIAVIAGFSLAGLLLMMPAKDRGQARDWSLRRRMVVLAATAIAAALVLAPMALALRHWGKPITPDTYREYPEAGPGGRFNGEDRPPFPGFLQASPRLMQAAIYSPGKPISVGARKWLDASRDGSRRQALFELVLLLMAIGWARLTLEKPEARRMLLLPGAALLGHLIALPITPRFFLPQRYVLYTIPLLMIVFAASAFAGLWVFDPARRWVGRLGAGFILACNVGLLVVAGGVGSSDAGLDISINPSQRELYGAIAKLPKSAVIAGWPWEMDNVPYVARRTIFLSQETHMPFYTGYTLMTRKRMRALIAAYFATSVSPLERLHRDFGVTHMLVDLRFLEGRPPGYFRPFRRDINAALVRARGKQFEILRQLHAATVYRQGDMVVLDLSRLAPDTPAR